MMIWLLQITSLYGGPLEFLFVLESTEDPAFIAVSQLITDFKVGETFCWFIYQFCDVVWASMPLLHNVKWILFKPSSFKQNRQMCDCISLTWKCFFYFTRVTWLLCVWFSQGEVDAKIVIAGLSTTCSQKIHNQLVLVEFYSVSLSSK